MAEVGKTAAGRGRTLGGVVRAAQKAAAAGDEAALVEVVATTTPVLLDGGLSGGEREVAQVLVNLAAVAARRGEQIDDLTHGGAVRDLFVALANGATAFAAARAAEAHCDLDAPYVLVTGIPAGDLAMADPRWHTIAESVGAGLARLAERTAVEAGPGPVRALICLDPGEQRGQLDGALRSCRDLGRAHQVVVGLAAPRFSADAAAVAFREAQDAAGIARALLAGGGAVSYDALGAYRYLVQIQPGQAPEDHVRDAVDTLIAYDRRRRTQLLDTLERYLTERLSVIESARQLYIHPNTLRQRLGRIEELTGLALESEDLLSVELAIKLARLHGRDKRPA